MLEDADDFVVYHSPWKMGLAAAGGAIMAGLSMVLPIVSTIRQDHNVWIAYLIGLAGVLFFGLAAVKGRAALKNATPAVVLSRQGIDERSYLLGSAGFVPWSEIESFCYYRAGLISMIAVYLRDEKTFLQRQSPLKRFFTVTGKPGRQGAPMVISLLMLSVSPSELIYRMESLHRQAQPSIPTTGELG
jgi:hypothetical protein